MQHLLLFYLVFSFSLSAKSIKEIIKSIPNPRLQNSWVVDEPGVLGDRKKEMDSLIDNLEKSNKSEIAIVILNSIDENIPKDFAVELFKIWGIGKKGKDNGLLILHVLDQRRIEIETGYGTEGVLPDIKTKWIIDSIAIPFFKKNSFADGHFEMLKATIRGIENAEISKEELLNGIIAKPGENVQEAKIVINSQNTSTGSSTIPFFMGALGLLGMIAWGIGLLVKRPGKNPRKAYKFIDFSRYPHYAVALFLGGSPGIWEFNHFGTFWSLPIVEIFMFFLVFKMRSKLINYTRSVPRICSNCGKSMIKLSEDADDAELNKGQIAEEKIHSIDYDVWRCSCGNEIIEDYEESFSSHSKCPSCNFKTWGVERTVIVTSATTSHSGLKHVFYRCQNCGHNKMEEVVIPQESSSSSSSGSSSSGGSFGGGSSGGGGSGSSY